MWLFSSQDQERREHLQKRLRSTYEAITMPAVTGWTRHGSCIMVYAQLYCSQSIASSRPPPFARFPLLEGDVGGPPSLEGSVFVRDGRDRREAPAICFAGEERERPCAGMNREMSKTPFPKIAAEW